MIHIRETVFSFRRRAARSLLDDALLSPDFQHDRYRLEPEPEPHKESMRCRRRRASLVHGDLEAAARLRPPLRANERRPQFPPWLVPAVRGGRLERHQPPQARGRLQRLARRAAPRGARGGAVVVGVRIINVFIVNMSINLIIIIITVSYDPVGFHNFNLRVFNLRVSNPDKLMADAFLTRCRISMCQGLGPKKTR